MVILYILSGHGFYQGGREQCNPREHLGAAYVEKLELIHRESASKPADLAVHNLEDPSFLGQSTSSQSSLYFSTQSLRWIQNVSLPQ
ncbi:unnamed protein product [Porites lobata]|uniref:Uncharacterized protein n=1 Tax=Porites lobata TaxID=104759 RepID=A0ABN8NNH7_9CNID|nr:unnamed protein product [Porites lobata]